ncbi:MULTISPECIES: signal peptidase [Chryseobacterium]|uniref:Signal peptidase n=1 Tax=Chryseobacterium camelliae TaxID=1265445 RepID=A0ABU0TP01_9FLAO|nr:MULTISPECIES: signal peptidase [Chryseobacterium]MDT3407375.1 hypothetical protein [Pseudacidovorax intermedius]MDQ1098775.1 hypothetical protein [Chryseobacterium camelliae]MDQ1102699.1 hypothetical protein [Chryseobacterium sp. SORGH_AS_1048]MDR6086128.1 hypothetical protein [Chryseobacterium sp. SORGH_AS_0909]MDR6130498.1 hypothetical protein [Chryseobacterium sp. SORGH_AS_1175]
MKTLINKLISAVFLLAALWANAQGGGTPPNPGNGVGGVTPGAQAAPIDMYVLALGFLALMFIVFFAKKYKSQKI